MAYKPVVRDAQIVSNNKKKNGLFEVVTKLEDRSVCRVTFETDEEQGIRASHISRLLVEPCPVCKKDFLCNCMKTYMNTIADQAIKKNRAAQIIADGRFRLLRVVRIFFRFTARKGPGSCPRSF